MSNDKQLSSIDWIIKQLIFKTEFENLPSQYVLMSDKDIDSIIEQAKEKYEHEMCVFADEYASYVLEQSKSGIKGAMVSMCAWTFYKNRRNEQ